MKRKLTIAMGVTLAIGCIVFVIGIVIRDADNMSWTDYTESNIATLAEYIGAFTNMPDHRPSSLSELLRDPRLSTNAFLRSLVSGKTGTQYSFTWSNTTIVIVASRRTAWPGSATRIEKRYEFEEAQRIHSFRK
jgi:hypothetical protein